MRVATMVVVAALASLLVGACAGSNGEQADVAMGFTGADGLAGTMEVKVSESSVRLILHVTNTSSSPVELTFPTSQRHDFIVETTGGEEVWRWSEEMSFLQAISTETLPAGESWEMEAVWDPGDREGEYVATGVLTARDRDLRQRATFEL